MIIHSPALEDSATTEQADKREARRCGALVAHYGMRFLLILCFLYSVLQGLNIVRLHLFFIFRYEYIILEFCK